MEAATASFQDSDVLDVVRVHRFKPDAVAYQRVAVDHDQRVLDSIDGGHATDFDGAILCQDDTGGLTFKDRLDGRLELVLDFLGSGLRRMNLWTFPSKESDSR